VLTKLARYPYVGLLPLSGQSHHTFVQISLAQDTSWAETHLGGGLGLRWGGGASAPPSPGLATSLLGRADDVAMLTYYYRQ